MTTERSSSSPLGIDQEKSTASSQATAGRELDALIEARIFGSEVEWMSTAFARSQPHTTYDGAKGYQLVKFYSTSIADAWVVVEKMREKGYSVTIGTNACAYKQNAVKFYKGWRGLGHSIFDVEEHPEPHAVDETVPLAICKAALNVVSALSSFPDSTKEGEK